jgi:hypothetical protein
MKPLKESVMKEGNISPGANFKAGDQSSAPVLKTVYWTIAFWFLAAFIGGVMDIFFQPGTPAREPGNFSARSNPGLHLGLFRESTDAACP